MPTLDATVGGASANSYQDAAAVDVILDNQPFFAAYKAATSDDKDRFAIAATDRLESLIDWDLDRIGMEPAAATQRLMFPRIGTYDKHGNVLASDAIPDFVLFNHALQAGFEAEKNRAADPATRGLIAGRVGPLEATFDSAITSRQQVVADIVYKNLAPWRRAVAVFTIPVARA